MITAHGWIRYEHPSRLHHRIRIGRWLKFETERHMVPMKKIRNPFTGQRSWTLSIRRLKIEWY